MPLSQFSFPHAQQLLSHWVVFCAFCHGSECGVMCETRYITRNGNDLLLCLGPSRRRIAAHLVDLRLFLRRRETKDDTNVNKMVLDGKETLSFFQMQSKRTRVGQI